jgi:hypothetical protein
LIIFAVNFIDDHYSYLPLSWLALNTLIILYQSRMTKSRNFERSTIHQRRVLGDGEGGILGDAGEATRKAGLVGVTPWAGRVFPLRG